MTNPLKQGLTYISNNGQLRYASKVSGNRDASEFTYENEHWVQPVSMYRAAQQIQAGRPVSIASREELLGDHATNQESYIVVTNPKRHKKCIGIALNPALPGEMVHILPYGTFRYKLNHTEQFSFYDGGNNATANNLDQFYKPDFAFGADANYDNLIGKTVFINSLISEREDVWHQTPLFSTTIGILTVDEKDAYASYGNIVQVGHITDYNVDTNGNPTELVIEVSLEGDGRGPLDFTQYAATVADPFVINETDGIKIFSLGSRLSNQFTQTFKMYDSGMVPVDTDFIAVQDMSANPTKVTIIPLTDKIKQEADGTIDVSMFPFGEDRALINSFNNNVNHLRNNSLASDVDINNLLKDTLEGFIPEATESAATELLAAIRPHVGDAPTSNIIVETINTDSDGNPIPYPENVVSFGMTVQDGPYQIYISRNVYETSFGLNDSDNLGLDTHNDRNGQLMFADIKYGYNQNILGAYSEARYGYNYIKGDQVVVTRYGEVDLPPNAITPLIAGDSYYLGENGNIDNNPVYHNNYAIKIGFAKDSNTLIIAPEPITRAGPEIEHIGLIKPYSEVNGEIEHGYLPLNGSSYNKDEYAELHLLLDSWNWNLNDSGTQFTLPNLTSGSMDFMIKYKDEYASVPNMYAQTLYFNGVFNEDLGDTNNKPNPCYVEGSIGTPINITSLIKQGVLLDGNLATVNMDIALSNLDIHLMVDMNNDAANPDWVEILQGMHAFNNTSYYGYRWKVRYETTNNQYYLESVISDSNIGIAYQDTPFSPPRMLNGLPWKLSVRKYNSVQEMFDVQKLMYDIVSQRIPGSALELPVSAEAVIKYIQEEQEQINLTVTENFSVGTEGDLANSFTVYLPDNINAKFSSGIDFIKSGVTTITNNVGLLENNFTGEWWATPIVTSAIETVVRQSIINNPTDFDPQPEQSPGTIANFEAIIEHSNLKTDLDSINGQRVAPHGLIQGIDGTINAAQVGGITLRKKSGQISRPEGSENLLNRDYDTSTDFIPFVEKGSFSIENTIVQSDKDTKEQIVSKNSIITDKDLTVPSVTINDSLQGFNTSLFAEDFLSKNTSEINKYLNVPTLSNLTDAYPYYPSINHRLLTDNDYDIVNYYLELSIDDEDIDFNNLAFYPEITVGSDLLGIYRYKETVGNTADESLKDIYLYMYKDRVYASLNNSGVDYPIDAYITKEEKSEKEFVLKDLDALFETTVSIDKIDNSNLNLKVLESTQTSTVIDTENFVIDLDSINNYTADSNNGSRIFVYLYGIINGKDVYLPIACTEPSFDVSNFTAEQLVSALQNNIPTLQQDGSIGYAPYFTVSTIDGENTKLKCERLPASDTLSYNITLQVTIGEYYNLTTPNLLSEQPINNIVNKKDATSITDVYSLFIKDHTVIFDKIENNFLGLFSFNSYSYDGSIDYIELTNSKISFTIKNSGITQTLSFNYFQIGDYINIVSDEIDSVTGDYVLLGKIKMNFENSSYKVSIKSLPTTLVSLINEEFYVSAAGEEKWFDLSILEKLDDAGLLLLTTPDYIEKNVLTYDMSFNKASLNDIEKVVSIDYSKTAFTDEIKLSTNHYNFIRFPEEIKSISLRDYSLIESSTYTNLKETPNDLGGIAAGSTFDKVSYKSMWDRLLYKVVAPEVSMTLLTTDNNGNIIPAQSFYQTGNTVSVDYIDVLYKTTSSPITSLILYKSGVQEAIFRQDLSTWDYDRQTIRLEIPTEHREVSIDTVFTLTVETKEETALIATVYPGLAPTTIDFITPYYYGTITKDYGEDDIYNLNNTTVDYLTANVVTTKDDSIIIDYTSAFSDDENGDVYQASSRFWLALPDSDKKVVRVYDENGFDITNSFVLTDTTLLSDEDKLRYLDTYNGIVYRKYILKDFNLLNNYYITYHLEDKI